MTKTPIIKITLNQIKCKFYINKETKFIKNNNQTFIIIIGIRLDAISIKNEIHKEH